MIIKNPTMGDIPALRGLWKEAFSDTDDFLDSFFALAFSPERALIACEGEEIFAALYWLNCAWEEKTVAYVYAVATDKKHRGKGICKALMAELHNRVDRTVLVPADDGLRAFYGRLGYRDFGGMEEILCFSDETTVVIEKLTAKTYAKKRRMLLPAGSILQEGVFLPILEEMLVFYGGEGWLLAGTVQDEKFLGVEFLGDKALLPGILGGLDCTEAKVRCPGNAPFAMYWEAYGANSLPGYFAFALD